MRFLPIFFALVALPTAHAGNYCIALRGNGELMPAHWGSLARTVETYGVPRAIAGGSSASITSFLFESIQMNPVIANTNELDRSIRTAYLIKSMQGFSEYLIRTPKWNALLTLIKSFATSRHIDSSYPLLSMWLREQNSGLDPARLARLKDALIQVKASGIFAGPAVQNVFTALARAEQFPEPENFIWLNTQIRLLRETVSLLGKFDAKNDPAVLLRPGFIDFRALAWQFSNMAQFYALRDSSPAMPIRLDAHLDRCAGRAIGKNWVEFARTNPDCEREFATLIDEYYATTVVRRPRLLDPVGGFFPTLITTAIAQGESAVRLRNLKRAFEFALQPEQKARIGDSMDLIPAQIRFGYWGTPQLLTNIQFTLRNPIFDWIQTDKTQRFENLGQTSWEQALTLSPAEPGLSSFQELGDGAVSLGGWADLHPTLVLRAAGCENVVYITRRGGDSPFSQGIAKRIFRMDYIPWERLDPYNPVSSVMNNRGDPLDLRSDWSRMYNLANPMSSFAKSISEASSVVCTDWNSFDARTQWEELIADSYQSPIFEQRPRPFICLIYQGANLDVYLPGRFLTVHALPE